MKKRCVNCDGERLLLNVKVADRTKNGSGDLNLETYARPRAMLSKQPYYAIVKANVCEDCGFVMMFTTVSEVEGLKLGTN